jgi:hypothetical protein
MKWSKFLPVLISIMVIILVAVLQKYSKLFAAVTATMPLNIPLALWIVYASAQGDQATVQEFTSSLLMGIVPTLAFVVTIWLAARSGMKIAPILISGYAVWGAVLVLIVGVRRLLGL